MNRRERVRNAAKARRSFVTRRAELKLSALTNCFRDALEDLSLIHISDPRDS